MAGAHVKVNLSALLEAFRFVIGRLQSHRALALDGPSVSRHIFLRHRSDVEADIIDSLYGTSWSLHTKLLQVLLHLRLPNRQTLVSSALLAHCVVKAVVVGRMNCCGVYQGLIVILCLPMAKLGHLL